MTRVYIYKPASPKRRPWLGPLLVWAAPHLWRLVRRPLKWLFYLWVVDCSLSILLQLFFAGEVKVLSWPLGHGTFIRAASRAFKREFL